MSAITQPALPSVQTVKIGLSPATVDLLQPLGRPDLIALYLLVRLVLGDYH